MSRKVIKPQEQNDVLGDFTRRLERLGIDYMLTGSMALVYYALPRTTVDIDIVINLKTERFDAFVREFETHYYIHLQSARDAVYRRRMFNVLNQETVIKIDCVILKNDEYQLTAFARRCRVNYAGDFEVWLISKEDLILAKLLWAKKSGAERQKLDVASLIRNDFDKIYVGEWFRKLDLNDAFAESRRLLEQNYDDRYDA